MTLKKNYDNIGKAIYHIIVENAKGWRAIYRLIIVDDESLVRENIAKTMDFASCGFELAGCCENGFEALEKIDSLRPDLIVTDIQMPYMDGIELAREIKNLYPSIHIVFLTGYDEFEYAQQAVSLRVFDYLLKPISAVKLAGSLKIIKSRLDDQARDLHDMTRLRAYYDTSVPILRGSFLSELLITNISRRQIEYRIQALGMDFLRASMFLVAIISIDRDSYKEDFSQRDLESYYYAVFNIAEELTSDFVWIKPVYRGNEVTLIAALPGDGIAAEKDFERTLKHISDIINRHLPFTVSVGVSACGHSPAELHKCYAGAVSSLGYRVALGGNRVFHIADFEPESSSFPVFDEAQENDLMYAIKIGDNADVEEAVKVIADRVTGSPYSALALLGYFISVSLCLMRVASSYGVDVPESIMPSRIDRLVKTGERDCIIENISNACRQMRHEIANRRRESYDAIAGMAVEYIEKNYGDPELSISTLSLELSISASYLSSLFKKKTGMSVGSFITETRMARARELAAGSEFKNYEISELCGYKNTHYFCYVFKKHFGVSPGKMRAPSQTV